jgi:hypothetical protein
MVIVWAIGVLILLVDKAFQRSNGALAGITFFAFIIGKN